MQNPKFKIFIAHPDEKLVGLYRSKFREHFLLDSAHDGLASIRKIKLHNPHVILSSANLPLLSGIGLLKFVRNHPRLYSRPFILLGSINDLPDALSLGANDFLDEATPSDQIIARIYYHIRINKHLYV